MASILFAEGAFQAISAYLAFTDPFDGEAPANPLFPLSFLFIYIASTLYLFLLSRLDTPLARPFARPWVRRTMWGLVAVVSALELGLSTRVILGLPVESALVGIAFGPVFLAMIFSSGYGLAIAISAYRRSTPGTPAHGRALAFALAFGGRDILLLAHLAGGPILGNVMIELGTAQPAIMQDVIQALLGVATIVFVTFLTYGMLRSQLFDLDLRVKIGISRGTVASIILVAVFVVAKVVESYLNRTVGFVAGSFVAGALLFLVPRLNKVGDKVANTAMPSVQPTSDYLAYKKLEVYKAAVESAQETGGITPKDRATLDRLRAKLGLSEADAKALESELAATS